MIVSSLIRVAFTLIAGAALASCTLGPNYKRPVVTTPPITVSTSALDAMSRWRASAITVVTGGPAGVGADRIGMVTTR